MADALTPNYGFTQPEVGASSDTWGGKLNANWASLDTLLKSSNNNISLKVAKAGDTMTGVLTIAPPTGWAVINLNKPASGQYNLLIGQTAGLGRWQIQLGNAVAETGSNAGSDFALWRCNDAGAAMDNVMYVNRQTGIVQLSLGATVPAATASASKTTGALVVTGGLGVSGRLYGSLIFSEGSYITAPTGAASFTLDNSDGVSYNIIYGKSANKGRWYMMLGSSAAETGGNTGSDFTLYRYNDDGSGIGNVLTINRATGTMNLLANVASTSPTTGALVVSGGLGVGGAIQVTGLLTVNNNMVLGTSGGANIYTNNNTGSLQLSGGNVASVGASLLLLGAAHATLPNQCYSDASKHFFRSETAGGIGMSYTASIGVLQIGTYGTGTTGSYLANGAFYTSITGTSSWNHARFTNSNAIVGSITTNGTTTTYSTSSDADLKELDADYDPAEAIAIIRADPVLGFRWKATGEQAVGWFAQKSHAINPDLAVPPAYNEEELAILTERGDAQPRPGEPGFVPWGIDYGKRTPYLWAALSNVLDRLEALEAKLAIGDPKPMRKKAA